MNQIEYQACKICDALVRNINDNFESVSFEIAEDGDIQIKVILREKTKIELEYIEDMITEYTAMQETDCVRKPMIQVGEHYLPFINIVYQKE